MPVGRMPKSRYIPEGPLKLVKMVKSVGSLDGGLIGGINLQGGIIGKNCKNVKADRFTDARTTWRYKHAGAIKPVKW